MLKSKEVFFVNIEKNCEKKTRSDSENLLVLNSKHNTHH